MKKKFTLLACFTLLALNISCGKHECKNTNTVFDTYAPGSTEYNDELLKQIGSADPSSIHYWFDSYEEKEGAEYLHISIQGDNLCAKGIISVVNPDEKLKSLLKAKGKGYSGAELEHLQFSIYKDADKTELIYESMDAIID
jgi:hypothetical protein